MKQVSTFWATLVLLLTALSGWGQTVTGTVFEDVNYGGGAGRTYATANTAASASGFASGAIGRPGVRVELYDAGGTFLTATTTDATGNYSIGGLSSGTAYTVRVVNSALTSARPAVASTAGLLPVQTFRTNAGVADAQRVGGENPALTDGTANTGSLVVTGSTAANNIALSFRGVTNGGDASLFVDNVQVLQSGTPLGTNPIGNPSFEDPVLGTASGSYQYNVPVSGTQPWVFSPYSGIQANNSAFTPPNTGSGAQAAFVQSSPAGTGTVSQSFTLPLGTYQVRFAAANRGYGNAQTVNVVINGITVLANVQNGAAYSTFVTQPFTVGPASTGGQALSALNAQSVAPFTATAGAVSGVDFGFSYDVVTNTNDSGQGSVRQFLLNSNALGNASLAQLGQAAGQETSIFMIPNGVAGGAAPAGLQRTPAVASGLNGGSGPNLWARLQVLSPLPTITDAATTLDATTQTTNIDNSNPGQVGTGGTVGATAGTQTPRPLPLIDRPEVEIFGQNTLANVLRSTAGNTVVRGLALHGAGTAGNGTVALAGALDFLVEKCMLGTSALTIVDPSVLQANTTGQYNLQITGVSRGLVRNNSIAYANSSGLIYNGSTGSGVVNVTSNEFVQNGYRVAGGDNITAGDNGAANATGPLRIRANLIRSANSDGVQFDIGSFAGNNAITYNTFYDNGNGGLTIARSQLEGSAILYLQRNGARTGSNNDSIAYNVINQSQASGVVVGYGQRGVIITRNSIYFNGTPFNSPTGSNLGIDLIPQANYYVGSPNPIAARDYGNGDGVTPNNGPASVNTAYGNAGINYPIITYARVATLASTTVSVGGYVGSAPGQTAFAGAVVDFYAADNVPANNAGQVLAGDGRRVAHGEGRTYVGSLTADANGNFVGTITVPNNTPPNNGAASTGLLTATATLVGASNYGTSEFSPNAPIIITADVFATITGVTGGVSAGATGTFTVQFGNQSITGPVQADGVTAQVQLPPGLTGVTATNGGTYDPTTGIISYVGYTGLPANSLASGASFSSVVSYPQPVTGALAATATILTTTNEGGLLGNNTATAVNATNLLYDVATTVAGPATAVQGAQVSYNVTTTNPVNPAFPSPAPQVVQTVSIPVGASNVYVTGGGVITGSTGLGFTVTYPALAALAPGQRLTNTVSFTAPASASFGVTGTVATSPADGASPNNTSTATTTATAGSGPPANVYVTISPSSSTVALNGAVSLTVEQGNYGPNAAAGIQTTVLLPPGLPTSGANAPTLAGYTLSASTATTATYTSGTNTATYSTTSGLFTLPAVATQPSGSTGGTANTYTLGYVATTAGVFPATATVATTTPDPVLGDNVASAEVTVNPGVADLSVALTGPTTVAASEPLTYTLTTTNNGPADAQAVRQTVSILAGLGLTGPSAVRLNGALPTSVSGTVATYGSGPTAATYNALTGIVTFPAAALPVLAVGSAVSNTITYLAPANGNTVLTNTAAVQSSSPDNNLANNSASVAAPLQPVADVQVTISSTGFLTTNASGGNPVLFGVSTVNNGPSIAPSASTTVNLPVSLPITGTGPDVVRLNGQLPSSVSGLVATYNFPDGSSATYDSNPASGTPGLVTFSTQTNLTPGGSGISATIGFVLPTGYIGQLVATARVVVGGILDTDQSNNIALAQPILAPATGSNDVSTTVMASATTLTAGQSLTLTVTSNPGTGATGVLQYLQLPAGLTSSGGTVTVSGGPGGSVVTGGTLSPNYDNTSGLLTFPAVLSLTATTSYSVVISSVPGKGPLVATASITANELDSAPANNVQVASVAITPSAMLAVVVTGPATAPAGTIVSYLLAATNNGPSTATGVSQTLTLPAGVTAYSLNGGLPIVIGGPGPTTITLPIPTTLVAGAANSVSSTVTFVAPGAVGSSFAVSSSLAATGPAGTATVTGSQTTTIISPPPIAFNVVNNLTSPEGNSALVPLALSPLQAQPQGLATLNAATPFIILSLPLASQGVLSLSGSPVTVGQTLTTTQAGQLAFLPNSGFVGNAVFTYQALDNGGLVSNIARYLIPVGADNAAVYANTPLKGGTNAYNNGDVIAFVIDPNGALYNGSGLIYQLTGANAGQPATGPVNNGVQTTTTTGVFSSTTVPAITSLTLLGLTFNPATGQITVIDRTKLKAGTYTLNITTTDLRGGVTTLPVTFTIGAQPLPVELTAFTAEAQGQAARLSWSTASEKNSAHFEVERSANGTTFQRLGDVAAAGTSTAARSYSYLDREAAQTATLVYYRLKQVDLDGTFSYSPVRTVAFAPTAPAFAVYPNPASARTTLDLTRLPAGSYRVSVLDGTGRLVRQLDLSGGLTSTLDLADLAIGTYLVRLTSTAGTAISLSQRLSKE
ncbi:T9SS type A sorting domain-containing protein [Hymenobacter sp. UYCo722]|uniref:T9SS type A sorting domain-containing protein n=1 Tax=Hymenobacter sp. UYCo722 TaxID=3156335 RepID=UPI00339B7E8A